MKGVSTKDLDSIVLMHRVNSHDRSDTIGQVATRTAKPIAPRIIIAGMEAKAHLTMKMIIEPKPILMSVTTTR